MEQEYFIEFFTASAKPGTIDAIRVRIDMVNISDMTKPLPINLVDHPLYPNLKQYVKKNS